MYIHIYIYIPPAQCNAMGNGRWLKSGGEVEPGVGGGRGQAPWPSKNHVSLCCALPYNLTQCDK